MNDPLLDRLSDRQRARAAIAARVQTANEEHNVLDAATDYATKTARMTGASVVQSWAERKGDEREDGEGAIDALLGAMSAAVDLENEEEIGEEEQEQLDTVAAAAYDYLLSEGATEEDLDAIFYGDSDEEAAAAAERVYEMLGESYDSLTAQGDQSIENVVIFGMSPYVEGVTLDGVSWAKMHRGRSTLNSKHGKKNVVNHRMKWRKATSAQRAALKKNSRRAHTALAKMLNRKSNLRTRKLGGRKVV